MNYLAPLGPVFTAMNFEIHWLVAAGLAMLQALDADRDVFNRLKEKQLI
jgi:glutamate-1-semialdehyde 2,1-aminomutase